jgi:hypothetical protein
MAVWVVVWLCRWAVAFIDLINPLNLIDLLFRLLYRPSKAGRLQGHKGSVVSNAFSLLLF